MTVQQLKAHLCPSPVQLKRSDSENAVAAPQDDDDAHADSEPDDAEVDVEGEAGEQDVAMAPAAPNADHSDEDSLTAPTLRMGGWKSDDEEGDDQEGNDEEGDDGGDGGSAGGPEEEESEVDQRDSQVGTSWLSKFYQKYGEFGKTWKPDLPRCVQEGDRPAMLENIRRSLEQYSKEVDG